MKSIRIIAAMAMVALGAALGCASLNRSETAVLQGTWNGREPGVSPEAPRQLSISGNQVEYRGAIEQDWGKGTFTLREDTQPKQLMVALAECGMKQYEGKTARLIFKIENGTLTAAANEPGNPSAPPGFDAPHARKMVFRKE